MRKHRTLKEYTAIAANIIYKEGEITEEDLIDSLEQKGVSHWTWTRLRVHILKRLAVNYSDIKLNHRQTLFWIGHLEDSLASLSTNDKEDMK